jgi:hypothetical protein
MEHVSRDLDGVGQCTAEQEMSDKTEEKQTGEQRSVHQA